MLIGDAIRDILSPHRNAIAQSADLARAIMDSLEAVCWSVADDYADKWARRIVWRVFVLITMGRLTTIIRRDRVLSTLLDEKQSSLLIGRTLRLLVLFASRKSHIMIGRVRDSFVFVCRFLSFSLFTLVPRSRSTGEICCTKRFHSITVVRTRMFFLDGPFAFGRSGKWLALPFCHIRPERNSKVESVSSIMNFIAILSLAHPDALTILSESVTLVPSLLYYLTQQATLIWEDDEKVMNSVEAATSWVYH